MKTFQCDCDERPILFFESNHCLACGRGVGLDDGFNQVEPYELDEKSGQYFKAEKPKIRYQKCDNNAEFEACNGMVNLNTFIPSANEGEVLCFACRFNETIPDLTVVAHTPLWEKMERAKRRALYTLKKLPLSLRNISQDPENGLSFDFITDRNVDDHFISKLKHQEPVFTGHDCGHITINLSEADDVARHKTKIAMGENYRTLLGHFRHELGHYYFDQLINSPERQALCKQYFGDDESDYQEAMDRHYEKGAPKDWSENFISEYATMHPYEDWAESWAHYMHIIDTLETAQNFSISGSVSGDAFENEDVGGLALPQSQYYFSAQTPIANILETWMKFSVILNSLNRSMGLQDAYPFVLTETVCAKLSFIHHAIHNRLDQLPELNKK